MSGNARPTPALLKVLNQWRGGYVRMQRNKKLDCRLDVNFDRPEKNNCLSGSMMLELGNISKTFADPKNALIVFSGIGKSFCSGADLGLIKDISDQNLGIDMFEYMSAILRELNQSSAISISRIHGHVLGGATEICSSTDIRIAHRGSKIGFFQSKMGIVPSWGGADYLEKIMGRGKALSAMGRANVMSADEAKSIGWIDFIYEDDDEAENFINSIANNGTEVTKAQKAMLNAVKSGRDAEKEVLDAVWKGETHKRNLQKQIDAVVKK